MDPQLRSILRSISLLTQVGLSVVVSLLLGIILGRWVDGLLGTEFLATILGIILGIGAGGVGAYRLIGATLKDDNYDR